MSGHWHRPQITVQPVETFPRYRRVAHHRMSRIDQHGSPVDVAAQRHSSSVWACAHTSPTAPGKALPAADQRLDEPHLKMRTGEFIVRLSRCEVHHSLVRELGVPGEKQVCRDSLALIRCLIAHLFHSPIKIALVGGLQFLVQGAPRSPTRSAFDNASPWCTQPPKTIFC